MSLPTTPPAVNAELSQNARTVLTKRYLVRDASGAPTETPEDMFWRVATTVAEADRRYGASDAEVEALATEFYALMTQRRFEPNSPTLMNAGRPLGQLSACFVLPVDDALSNGQTGIYDTLRSMALIHQSGGGTGFSFSRLRAKGAMVRSTTGVASGPVSFMKLYDASTDAVKQGGTRRGANMGILRVDHPDVLDFVACKEDLTQITNFNISVGITTKFMEALKAGGSYDLVDPTTKQVTGSMDARTVWDKMVLGAWRTGEPGVFFVDEANRYNPVPHLGPYEATNPCGEQPLLPYDVCNLGSVNVGYYVRTGSSTGRRTAATCARRRASSTTSSTSTSTRSPRSPRSRSASAASARRDGLRRRARAHGHPVRHARGRGDGAPRDGVPRRRVEEGERAPRRRARAVPEWARSIWGPDETCARDEAGERIRPMQMLRNCNVTTVAPTGTISIIAGCSSGLEPLFAVAFMRNQAGVMMPDVNEDFVAIASARGGTRRSSWSASRRPARCSTPRCRSGGSACSSRRTTSRPRCTCACRPPSSSTATRRSARRRTSRTRRRRTTCGRSTSSPTTSSARA
jgi:ribonucleoside-diphosphate reductase alpha chain